MECENKVFILGTQHVMEKVLALLKNPYYTLEDMLYLLVQYWYFGGEREHRSLIIDQVHDGVCGSDICKTYDEIKIQQECARVWKSIELSCELLNDDLRHLEEVDLDVYHPTAVNEVAGDLYVQFEALPKWAGGPTP